MSGILPEALFDNQVFVDAFRVKWVYHKASNYWIRIGQVGAVPIADGTNIGLLPSRYKYLIDTIPPKGGGFAIITKPLLAKRSLANPDGVLFGNIKLKSDSIKITCVDSDGKPIGDACARVAYHEYDKLPPGFDLNLSDNFLNTFCVEIPGGPGPAGADGEEGDPGEDGTGDGPVGLKGESGKDALTAYTLSGVKIIDIDDVYDIGVVKLELDAPNGKLFVTKGKMVVPNGADVAADQLIAAQISRAISFTDECWEYDIKRLPCRFNDDFDVIDPLIAFYPDSFNPDQEGRAYPLVRARLSDLINTQINIYQKKLDDAAKQYDQQISDFMKAKDEEARKVLDELGDRLAECENITYLEYCMGITGECGALPVKVIGGIDGGSSGGASGAGAGAGTEVPSSDPSCMALIEYLRDVSGGLNCSDLDNSNCTVIGDITITAKINPVLSIPAPCCPPKIDPFASVAQAEAQWRNYVNTIMQPAANQAMIIYPKQQLHFSEITTEFPAGSYAFIYSSGAFRQDRRNVMEQFDQPVENLINGSFQDFYVGNTPTGRVLNPLQLILPGGNWMPFTSPFVSTEAGIEIGFAPKDYISAIPGDYFDKHAFNMDYETGLKSYELPNPRTDYVGLPAAAIAMEQKISWTKFPDVSGTHSDAAALQAAYQNVVLKDRMVSITTQQPGFFFIRCKVATGALTNQGTFVAPPITPAGSLGNGLPIRDVSFNVLWYRYIVPGAFYIPYLNAKPYAEGQVSLKIMSVNCAILPPAASSGAVTVGPLGSAVSP